MARKKKSKKKTQPKKSKGAAKESSGSDKKKTQPKKSKKAEKASAGSKKKKTQPKKSKKAEKASAGSKKKASETRAAPEPEAENTETVEAPPEPEIDLDLDIDGAEADELVAQVADLDAVIDDEDDAEDLDALIAATVAGAGVEDVAEETPVAAVEDPVVETLDVEVEESGPVPYPEAQDAADEALGAAEAPDVDAPEPAPSSEEELAGTIDLGEGTTPEVRDRLLAQALAHAEMQDARYRVPYGDPRGPRRWKGAVATLLFLVASVAAVAPPSWVRPEPPAQIDTVRELRSLRSALLIQAQQIDAYRIRTQRLPATLQELPVELPGVRYVRSGNRSFQLMAYQSNGRAVVYDSSNPAPEFERLAPSWTGRAAP